jgi:hypothetical protein
MEGTMCDPADSPRYAAPPTARVERVPHPAPAAAAAQRLSVWRLGVAVLLLAVLFSPAVAQAEHKDNIDLAQYPPRYVANDGYVYTGRRAQVLHHLHARYATRATTYAGHTDCATCSADLWTPGAWYGHDNTELQSMQELAEYIRENDSALGIKYVIWNKRYSRGGKWRKTKTRGSLTAQHKDHVHITFEKRFK